MKVLIFGPSGSGKTYISKALKDKGVAAFDADEIKGLSAWYDGSGQKVPAPANAEQAITHQYSFLWSKKFLTTFLKNATDAFIFGGSGNVFNMLPLFDKIFFLHVDPETQKQRLLHSRNRNPDLDFNQDKLIIWGRWLEEEAVKREIPFIDSRLPPLEIYAIISKDH